MNSNHQDLVYIIDDIKTEEGVGYDTSIPADGLITQERNVALLLTTADCLPVSLFDPVTNTIGLIHLSRHTFVLGLIEKIIATLHELMVDPKNIQIIIGPHIHRTSYCFPLPLTEEPERIQPYIEKTSDHACIDLAKATVDTFTTHGVTQIAIAPIDTYTSPEHFSHVRSAKNHEPEGRLATIVALV